MTTDALQAALGSEHAAVYVLSTLGARTSASAQPRLHARVTATYRTHVARREALRAMVRAAGAAPVAAEPAYDVPARLDTGRAIQRRALRVERACSTAYTHLIANTTGEARQFGIDALIDCARREIAFGGDPRPLPGL